jgi:hypothetical protein
MTLGVVAKITEATDAAVENIPRLRAHARRQLRADASTFGPTILNLNNWHSKLVSHGCSLVLSIAKPKSLMHGVFRQA